MIVFATNLDYIETPYVSAEWHTFVNDINTGHKPNAKIVTILSPDIDVHYLPAWLRDKQCFTTENYKDSLLHFLNGWNKENVIAFDNDSCSNEFDHVVPDIDSDGATKESIDFGSQFDEVQDALYDKDYDGEYVCNEENDCRRIEIREPNSITDTFEPNVHHTRLKGESAFSRWKRLFIRGKSSYDVFSSIFTPAEVFGTGI
jgi:hypothetical protein